MRAPQTPSPLENETKVERKLSVTFDTNTLDKIARPARFPKDPNNSKYIAIHNAVKHGTIRGFFCECLISLEAIPQNVRPEVFGNIRIEMRAKKTSIDGTEIVEIDSVSRTNRPPIHLENLARIRAASAIGIRAIHGPSRAAQPRVDDPDKFFFAYKHDDPIVLEGTSRAAEIAEKIEARGLGMRVLKSLGQRLSPDADVQESWRGGLLRAQSTADRKAIGRAIAEWADCDSISAHIGFGHDIFCTSDRGRNSGGESIFSDENRKWLSENYRVTIMDINDLFALLNELSLIRSGYGT